MSSAQISFPFVVESVSFDAFTLARFILPDVLSTEKECKVDAIVDMSMLPLVV